VASTFRTVRKRSDDSKSWRESGLRYHSYRFFLQQAFGHRVQKVSIDAGFTCPNVDGSVAIGGCVFCDNRSFSPSRRVPRVDIRDQIDEGIRRLKRRYKCDHFMAYFQPATNTYAPVDRLETLYRAALSHPKIDALAIGTRPDCLPEDVIGLLSELSQSTYLSLEIGVQSIHNRSLEWMNRGHDYDSFVDAVQRCRQRGFEICTHVILGLPGESHEDMMATADAVAELNVDAIKIHNLYAVENTPLAEQVRNGEVELMDRPSYVQTIVDFLERLPPQMVVERISGDAPPDYFVGPSWCLDKPALRNAIFAELEERDSWQGKRFSQPD